MTVPHTVKKTLNSSSASPWFIENEEVCDVVPRVAVMVEVVHWGLQRWLQGVWVILKKPQDNTPHQCGKEWEGVPSGLGDKSLLYRQPWEPKQDSGQQVHVDLRKKIKSTQTHGFIYAIYTYAPIFLTRTWLLMLLLSPKINHPPTQAARKEWDCRLWPRTLCCRARSPLYVNTKHARLREWVYVALRMAPSLSFKLWE